MYKYILGIDGMRCGMCEVHVKDIIVKNIETTKVVASHLKKKYKQIVKTTIEDYKLYYEMYDKKRIALLNADKKAEIDKRFNESINRTIKENRKKEIKQAINKNAKKSINIFIIISMFFTTFLTNLDKKLQRSAALRVLYFCTKLFARFWDNRQQ